MNLIRIILGSILLILFIPQVNADDYNIMDFGASTGSKTICTRAIQNAIDECSAKGGGTVVIPTGQFITGTIVIKSNVSIKLQRGAILLGSKDPGDYLSMKPSYMAYRTATETRQLIYAENQDNIAITGEGTIDGQGASFVPADMDGAGITDAGITRPHLIQFISCTNIKIEGVFLTSSGAWMQHYLACDHLTILNIRVNNFSNINNDGVDIDGCHDVIISGCIFSSADDGICLKATSPRSCRNVLVSNCTIHSLSNAIKLGTETTGGFQNIIIDNCTISPVENNSFVYNEADGVSGISLMIVDGGILENVTISNISITETNCPIFIRLGNRARKYIPGAVAPPVGRVRNVTLSNIIATSSYPTTSSIVGIPGHEVENIVLDNVRLINRSNASSGPAGLTIPESNGYPTANMHGSILPASGFYIRHARNIRFNNFQLIVEGVNTRPAFVLDDVRDMLLIHPQVLSQKGETVLVEAHKSSNIKIIETSTGKDFQ